MTRRLAESVSYLNGVINKIELEIRAKQIRVDAKDSGLTSPDRVKLIGEIESLKRELEKTTERRDSASSSLRGMTGVI